MSDQSTNLMAMKCAVDFPRKNNLEDTCTNAKNVPIGLMVIYLNFINPLQSNF